MHDLIKKIALLLCPVLLSLSAAPFTAAAHPLTQEKGGEAAQLDPFMRGTLLSGPTADIPWAKSTEFAEAKKKNGCPVQMAAYKTVLKDPLPGEEYNVHLAAKYICGTVLAPGEVFSQNKKAGPYTLERGFQEGPTYNGTNVSTTIGGGVCKIASTLFNVVILSDLAVVERHTHTMPVPYVPYGQDATVFYGSKDFKFKNSTAAPILIWAQGVDNILYIGFYGRQSPPKVEWSHRVIEVYKAPVLTTKNPELKPGSEKMLHEGMDGGIIESSITLTYPDGTTKTKDFGKSRYEPLPFIKEIGG